MTDTADLLNVARRIVLDDMEKFCEDPAVLAEIGKLLNSLDPKYMSLSMDPLILQLLSLEELTWEILDVFARYFMRRILAYEQPVKTFSDKIDFLRQCDHAQLSTLIRYSEVCAWLLREATESSLSLTALKDLALKIVKDLLQHRSQDPTLKTALASFRLSAADLVPALPGSQDRYYNASFRQFPFIDPLLSKNADMSLVAHLGNYIKRVASKDNNHYSRYIPLIQSTGFGKSRLVFELARSAQPFVVVPICMRAKDATGEPPRTEPIVSKIEGSLMTELQWGKLFAALVEEVAKRVQQQPALKTDQLLRQSWYEALSGVAQSASSSYLSSASSSSSRAPILNADYGMEFWKAVVAGWEGKQSSPEQTPDVKPTTDSWVEFLSKELKGKNQALKSYIVVVALDECSSILMRDCRSPGGRENKSITAMARTLSWEGLPGSWNSSLACLLLDTTSKVANFAPEFKLYPSNRVAVKGHALFPPFFAFPQRLYRSREYPTGTIMKYRAEYKLAATMFTEDIGSVRLAVKRNPFEDYLRSRPLFASRAINEVAVNEVASNESSAPDELVLKLYNVVRDKLLDSKRLAEQSGKRIDLYYFSLAAMRWQLTTISQVDQADLLHMHLAVLFGLAPKNERIYCGYPLEPALLRGAATIMAQDPEEMQLRVLEAVQKQQMDSMLVTCDGKGEAGEMVALMLLCFAHDVALQATKRSRNDNNETFYHPILFLSLMEQLYPPESFTRLLEDLTAQYTKDVLQHLQTALVYFTGGCKLEVPITVELLRKALKEGVLLMAMHKETAMDAYIPLVLPKKRSARTNQLIQVDLEDPSTYDLTCVCVQIKNTQRADSATSLVDTMRRTPFAQCLYELQLPLMVCLVMQLGDLQVTGRTKKGGLVKENPQKESASRATSSSTAAAQPLQPTATTIAMEMRLVEGAPCIGALGSSRHRVLREMLSFSDKDLLLRQHMEYTWHGNAEDNAVDIDNAVESYRDVWFHERSFGDESAIKRQHKPEVRATSGKKRSEEEVMSTGSVGEESSVAHGLRGRGSTSRREEGSVYE